MLTITAVRDIPASSEQVWEVLCDTEHYPEWIPGTEAVTRTDGPAAAGSTYDEVNPVIGPWRTRTRWRVTEYDRLRRMVHTSNNLPMMREGQVVMTLEEAGASTRVTLSLRGTPSLGPLGRLFAKALTPRVRKDNEQSLLNLAARLSGA